MRGIDTNVLVRYIMQDDVEQSRLATQFIEKQCSADEPGFVNAIVLCELVWVLESVYECSRAAIASVLEKILRVQQLHVHESPIIWSALRGYKNEAADFADHYICSLNSHNNCEYTVTFDKKAGRLAACKLLAKN